MELGVLVQINIVVPDGQQTAGFSYKYAARKLCPMPSAPRVITVPAPKPSSTFSAKAVPENHRLGNDENKDPTGQLNDTAL